MSLPIFSLRRYTAIFFAPMHTSGKFAAFQTLCQSAFFKSFEAAAPDQRNTAGTHEGTVLSLCQPCHWSHILPLHRKTTQCAKAMFPTHECHSFLEPGLPHSEGRVCVCVCDSSDKSFLQGMESVPTLLSLGILMRKPSRASETPNKQARPGRMSPQLACLFLSLVRANLWIRL